MMKTAILKTTVILLVILAVTSCKKNFIISNKQAILFQFEYINYAWGYQHHGFIIDAEGDVLKYDKPENWNFCENDSTLTSDGIVENLGKCIPTGVKIPMEELQRYSSYIDNLAHSKITAPKNVAADAGSAEYLCYEYSESKDTYRCILIKQEGDFTCENLNYYTKRVVDWMNDVGNRIPEQ
jgi:hypothetical protein